MNASDGSSGDCLQYSTNQYIVLDCIIGYRNLIYVDPFEDLIKIIDTNTFSILCICLRHIQGEVLTEEGKFSHVVSTFQQVQVGNHF